jgi:hypothetical protein
MAPTLRELVKADGSRVAVLDVILQVKSFVPHWRKSAACALLRHALKYSAIVRRCSGSVLQVMWVPGMI